MLYSNPWFKMASEGINPRKAVAGSIHFNTLEGLPGCCVCANEKKTGRCDLRASLFPARTDGFRLVATGNSQRPRTGATDKRGRPILAPCLDFPCCLPPVARPLLISGLLNFVQLENPVPDRHTGLSHPCFWHLCCFY